MRPLRSHYEEGADTFSGDEFPNTVHTAIGRDLGPSGAGDSRAEGRAIGAPAAPQVAVRLAVAAVLVSVAGCISVATRFRYIICKHVNILDSDVLICYTHLKISRLNWLNRSFGSGPATCGDHSVVGSENLTTGLYRGRSPNVHQ